MATGTDRFVHFHMPKTGSTWLASVLADDPDWRDGDRHRPASEIADRFTGRERVAMIRNPWDWYASWWRHCMQAHQVELGVYGVGSVEFRDVLEGIYIGQWAPPEPGIIAHGVMGQAEWCADENKPGLYTLFVRHFLQYPQGGWCVDVLLDQVQSYEAAEALVGHPVDRERFPPVQTSEFTEAVEWDAEMVEWVREMDGHLAGLFGYDGPGAKARSAVMDTRRLR